MKFGPRRRVQKRPEFLEIQRTGRKIGTRNFVFILARGSRPEEPARLGITASRRVGNSVRRSRLKRIVRAAFVAENGMLPRGFDLVVICKRDEPGLSLASVLSQWRSVRRRVHKALSELQSGPAP